MAKEFKVIGKPFPLREAREKVAGSFKYVDDIPAELYVKILRSPYPHAMIKTIYTGEAEKLDGVAAVLTYKDVPHRLMPRGGARACYILGEHLRFVGDEVAAVAAKSEAIAEEALDLMRVDYEVLPAVFDPEEATKEDAPKLYPEGNVYGPQFGPLIEKGINAPTVLEWGDIDKGFKEADVVVEDRFEVKPQVHSPIELHACIASWKGDKLTLWCSTQCPYEVREGVAYVLGMPEVKVRVISPAIGGGFGCKYLERYIPIAALLSKKSSGRSTKIVFTREEEQCHVKRAGDKTYVKIGAKRDGTITAILFRSYKELGGYGSPHGGTSFCEETPAISYKTKNARFEGWDVHTNHFSTQPCRSVHLPAWNFALEQVIDEVAEKLVMDPVKFRMQNMPDTGDIMPSEPYKSSIYERAKLDLYPAKKVIQEIMKKIDWGRWKGWGKPAAIDGTRRRGMGLVYSAGWSGFCHDGFMSVAVTLNKDGSINIMSGHQDIGTGSNTTLCMLAAESLGISLEDVNIFTADTSICQYDFLGARSSRELATGGHLVLVAIEELKQKVREIAGPVLKVKPEEVEVKGKTAYVKSKEEKAIPLSSILTTSITTNGRGPVGSISPMIEPGVKARQPLVMAAEVEVDIETGQVRVVKIITGNCPGTVINPEIVRGQYIGGATQSLGLALYEDFNYDEENRKYLSCNFADYKVPRALDTPPIESVILEELHERPAHIGPPYGAMGVGELGAWGGPAVIANAIYNAIGVRIKKCPMTAEVVLEALGKEVSQ